MKWSSSRSCRCINHNFSFISIYSFIDSEARVPIIILSPSSRKMKSKKRNIRDESSDAWSRSSSTKKNWFPFVACLDGPASLSHRQTPQSTSTSMKRSSSSLKNKQWQPEINPAPTDTSSGLTRAPSQRVKQTNKHEAADRQQQKANINSWYVGVSMKFAFFLLCCFANGNF